MLCAILTDNRNRTASEIRHIFSRNNGNLGETGCVSWMFERKGLLTVELGAKSEDDLMMVALEAGADDLEVEEDEAEITIAPDMLEEVRGKIIEAGFAVLSAEITMLPSNTIAIDDVDMATKLMRLTDALDDNDDVQGVYANYDIPDSVLEQLD